VLDPTQIGDLELKNPRSTLKIRPALSTSPLLWVRWIRPVPQVRVRSLDANLGGGWSAPMGFPLSSPSGSAPRHRVAPTPQPLRSSQLFSSHFSRTLITDLLPNRGEDTSTVHHRELRQSPETNAFPAANFSPLFDNKWPRSAPSQVHAKQQNSMLSPIFWILCL